MPHIEFCADPFKTVAVHKEQKQADSHAFSVLLPARR